jgi:predicted O-methyltransferase YrrM
VSGEARALARALLPRWLLERYRRNRKLSDARRLGAVSAAASPGVWWDAISQSIWFRPLQDPREILGLLDLVRRRAAPLHATCEIGVAAGGTAFLLSRAAADDATLVLVDRDFADGHDTALPLFAREGQRLRCVRGDSQADATRDAVTAMLQGRRLDLLLIDADHSLTGVSRDFALYTPLVRPGGLVALHDINPDHRTRFGHGTGDAGHVTEFWRSLSPDLGPRHEFVADPAQDGGGLGVIEWRG